MGILSDLRKLIFGAKSVSKSAVNKTIDYGKEKGGDAIEKTKDVLEDAGEAIMEKTSGLREAISDKAENVVEKAKDIVEDIKDKFDGDEETPDVKEKVTPPPAPEPLKMTEDVPDELKLDTEKESIGEKAKEFTENVGDKVLDAGEATMEKAKDIAESVGEKVITAGGEAMEKAKDLSEKVGEKVIDAKEAIVEKAKEVTEKLGEKLDETIEKAEAMAEAEKNTPKKEFADKPIDVDDSLLDGTDDFFSKMEKFADGNNDAFVEGQITINENVDIKKDPEATKSEDVKAAGFEDRDGDGDEIIDDAIVSED